MKKLYYHPCAHIDSEGKAICVYCQKEVNEEKQAGQ